MYLNPHLKNEIIVRSSFWGYFKLRHFDIWDYLSQSNEEIIDMFIKSDYFHWMNKRKMQLSDNLSGNKKELNWNFHGMYDVTKIVPSDFVSISFDSYKKVLLDFLYKYNTDVKKLSIIEKAVDGYYEDDNTFYILTISNKSKLNSFTVFAWFFSSIMINTKTKTFVTIEYGMD